MAQSPKHSIKAYLYDNPLTDDPNDFTARVKSEKSLNIESVSASAVDRGGANISAGNMSHAVRLWLQEMDWLVNDSYAINTGYFTVMASVKGAFNSPNEKFNRAKHSLSYQFSQGEIMRQGANTADVDILGLADIGAEISMVIDIKSDTVNDKITPERNLKITGSKIRIVGDDPSVGVYFRHNATGTVTKVDDSDIVTNMPSEVMIINPTLAPGEYTLVITTQFSNGSTLLKEPRSAEFGKVLTVL